MAPYCWLLDKKGQSSEGSMLYSLYSTDTLLYSRLHTRHGWAVSSGDTVVNPGRPELSAVEQRSVSPVGSVTRCSAELAPRQTERPQGPRSPGLRTRDRRASAL